MNYLKTKEIIVRTLVNKKTGKKRKGERTRPLGHKWAASFGPCDATCSNRHIRLQGTTTVYISTTSPNHRAGLPGELINRTEEGGGKGKALLNHTRALALGLFFFFCLGNARRSTWVWRIATNQEAKRVAFWANLGRLLSLTLSKKLLGGRICFYF